VPAGAGVLDFGAGDGLFAGLLSRAGHDVTAVEPDPARRRTAERLFGGEGVRFAARLDELPDGIMFDAILVVDVFYCIPRVERKAVARRLAGLLNKGGCAIIKEVVSTRDWRESFLLAQERLLRSLLAKGPEPPCELPSAAELNALAALFGTVIEERDIPVGWYWHRIAVARAAA
jgi:2-polyprenyl-3-methyl-5-hydroxy-6-metoxy-1,4-benzoquinol methylase